MQYCSATFVLVSTIGLQDITIKILCVFLISSVRATCAAYLVLNWIHLITSGRGTLQSVPPCAVLSTAPVTADRVTDLPGTANTATAQQIALPCLLRFITVFTKIKPYYPSLSYFSQLHMQILHDVSFSRSLSATAVSRFAGSCRFSVR
jgi:hypothetical protein